MGASKSGGEFRPYCDGPGKTRQVCRKASSVGAHFEFVRKTDDLGHETKGTLMPQFPVGMNLVFSVPSLGLQPPRKPPRDCIAMVMIFNSNGHE